MFDRETEINKDKDRKIEEREIEGRGGGRERVKQLQKELLCSDKNCIGFKHTFVQHEQRVNFEN